MAKKKIKTPILNIHDFFGAYNIYRIFALKSELNTYPFVNTIGQTANTTFTLLDVFEQSIDNFSAHFSVFYAEIHKQASIHCLLLENKAVINQQHQFVSKTEKKLHFQTGFLFEEWLYIFNSQGLRCFNIELSDIDYLLLIFTNKNIENEVIGSIINNLALFQPHDISYLLEKNQISYDVKINEFLRVFFCRNEVAANKFSRRRKLDLLAPIKQIPYSNLLFRIPVLLENESIADNFQLSDKYVKFLKEDY